MVVVVVEGPPTVAVVVEGPPTVSQALALKCEISGNGVAVSGRRRNPIPTRWDELLGKARLLHFLIPRRLPNLIALDGPNSPRRLITHNSCPGGGFSPSPRPSQDGPRPLLPMPVDNVGRGPVPNRSSGYSDPECFCDCRGSWLL